MYDQYGRERANAILGTVMTKIFLPGLDDVTAEYASKQLGDTTIFSKTFQDFPGKKHDNTRYAEQKRALMHASEIRQIAAHSEVLIVSDTAPPIRAAYPPMAVIRHSHQAIRKGSPRELHLGDIDPAFLLTESANTNREPGEEKQAIVNIISESVDKLVTDAKVEELLASSLENKSETVEVVEAGKRTETSKHEGALDEITIDLRFSLADQWERCLSPF